MWSQNCDPMPKFDHAMQDEHDAVAYLCDLLAGWDERKPRDRPCWLRRLR
jgi:hypothetical protein